jgi:hypothetical protein
MAVANLPNELGIGVELATFPCVRLRGLPFDVTDDSIRLFLVRATSNHVVHLKRSADTCSIRAAIH